MTQTKQFQFRTVLFGSMTMMILAVVLVPVFTDDEVIASWVIIGVGIVATGQILGYLAAICLSLYESRNDRRHESDSPGSLPHATNE